jgi:hypothetical protein
MAKRKGYDCGVDSEKALRYGNFLMYLKFNPDMTLEEILALKKEYLDTPPDTPHNEPDADPEVVQQLGQAPPEAEAQQDTPPIPPPTPLPDALGALPPAAAQAEETATTNPQLQGELAQIWGFLDQPGHLPGTVPSPLEDILPGGC